jgi:RNA polymerase sigma-70 factor (ECF subfamily)
LEGITFQPRPGRLPSKSLERRSEATLNDPQRADPVSDDRTDVALAAQGDQSAFERLYRAHVRKIYGLTLRMAGPRQADELTQDTFVRAWQKLHTFRGESSFATWLHRLAVNVVIEDRRGTYRRAWRTVEDEDAIGLAAVAPADSTFAMDFEAAVAALPEGARQVFVLHDVEGYKHHEIGTVMGIAEGTSKGQLHRARMMLRRHLGRT